MRPDSRPRTVAAVDLGSNSFHMVIGRHSERGLTVLDRLREPVRLAAGLDDQGRISDEAQERALSCLSRFGERLREVPVGYVRAVGTNTLRKAANGWEFRSRAAEVLGHPVEVVSGLEEARLVYLGVTRTDAPERGKRLVVDIGGGSTEIIVGRKLDMLRAHSLFMGCVSYSHRFFPDGKLSRSAFREAEVAARLELRAIARPLRALGWDASVGASGTVGSIGEMLGNIEGVGAAITLDGMKRLRRQMLESAKAGDLRIPGLKPDRAGVIPGGLAILIAVFKSLEIDAMRVSRGALREGLLWDLAGRLHSDDARDRTIRRLVDQYMVDEAQAERVARSAVRLYADVAEAWGIEGVWAEQSLTWAAMLREIGLAVSHTGYHKHSAYLAENSDMPGFGKDDQQLVAALIRGHRRRFSREIFTHLGPMRSEQAFRLCLVLRLASRLNRSRTDERLPTLRLAGKPDAPVLHVPVSWLEEHPLMRADLEQEKTFFGQAGVALTIEEGE